LLRAKAVIVLHYPLSISPVSFALIEQTHLYSSGRNRRLKVVSSHQNGPSAFLGAIPLRERLYFSSEDIEHFQIYISPFGQCEFDRRIRVKWIRIVLAE